MNTDQSPQSVISPQSKKEIWLWWERRRLGYNVAVIVAAIVGFAAYIFFLLKSGHLKNGEELIEPVALIVMPIIGPIIWNAAYCLGPIVDICVFTNTGQSESKKLFDVGLGFSIFTVSIPALYWASACFENFLR